MTTTSSAEFETRVTPFRRELHAYCYRLLGSVQDADDALQETLLGAWKGLEGFEGRSALRSWLYKIATHACSHLIAERPRRLLAEDISAPARGTELDAMVHEPIWLEPYPPLVDATFEQLESVELAFVAALQHLPATQRAVLVLREVLGFEAAEVAEQLDTTVASVNSALQRARESLGTRVHAQSQQATLRDLGDAAKQRLVTSFVEAWARADVSTLVTLLTDDVRFSMPPIPTWFARRAAVARFFRERVFATPWRLVPISANGQLAFACYQGPDFRLGAMNVLTVRGNSISDISGFLDPRVHATFSLPDR